MKLTNLFLASCLIAMVASCNHSPANGYKLTGKTNGLDGQTAYLSYKNGDEIIKDSTIITNGTFSFEGVADTPVQAFVIVGENTIDQTQYVGVYLEPGEIVIDNLAPGDFSHANISGTKTNDVMQEYSQAIRHNNDQMMDIYKNMSQYSDNKEKYDSISHIMSSLQAQKDSIDNVFINNHLDSYFTPSLYTMKISRMTYDELKDAYNALTPEVQAFAKEMKDEIDAVERTQAGRPAPELEGTNHNGVPEKLSDLKGKVVLIDFWATWCGPCRAALPHIYELYKKYNDKGFEVFCVADNDSDPENWAKFINDSKDGLANYHHILRGLKMVKDENGKLVDYDRSNDQSDKYAVHYLPTKFLIGTDGNIIGKIETNEELDAKLAEIFGE